MDKLRLEIRAMDEVGFIPAPRNPLKFGKARRRGGSPPPPPQISLPRSNRIYGS